MNTDTTAAPELLDLTVAVAIYNEEESIPPLCEALDRALSPLGKSYEILLVDDGSSDRSWEVLNDIVIARALSMRPIHLFVHVNEIELAEYVADGLILSTATGSTSYSQSVGGPILRPDMRNMLLTPISPNLCVDRSLVLPDTDTIAFTLGGNVDALVSPDGYAGDALQFGDQVRAKASEHSALFVRFGDKGIFYRNITRYMQRNPTIKGDYRS